MGGGEMKYVKEAFDSNWVAPLGPNVDAFERELCVATGAKHVAALSSGTAAIHLSLIMLGVGPDDYVIGTSFTFSATVNPIAYLGATPVLIDSESDTWNMDPGLLEEAIQSLRSQHPSGTGISARSVVGPQSEGPGRLPKAIIVAHLYGMPARMKEIMAVADKYGIPVVEDAAEALGSEYMGRRVGCNSKFGILSFNGNKIITTSGGGALISDDEALIARARFLATQARDPAPHYQHSVIGYNYRMSNVVAGVGRGQLEVLDLRVRQHRELNQWYRELLKDVPGVTFQSEPSPDFYSNFWLTCIVIDPAVAGTDREKLRLAFEAANIESRPLWKPMHLQPVFAGCPAYVNGTSEKLFENGLCLPSGSNIDDEGRERIAEVLKREFGI
jgi:dTDP-4-amino-4,6-dideoxygalactose transaminase